MDTYVDGFVIPVPKDRLEEYREMSEKAGAVWKEYGALEYRECVGDDLDVQHQMPFPTMSGAMDNETVVFSWIVFKSREHRDEVNSKVVNDPRIRDLCREAPPFDSTRMAYGGFRLFVDA